jgi:RsiW-degrading membrane proteinase PrsW (M82 family)
MLIVSSFPVIAVYIWYRFAKYPVSLIKLLITLLIGAAAIFPAILLQNLVSLFSPSGNRAALFYEFFFRIAFSEELSRMMLLFIFFLLAGLLKPKEDSQPLSWSSVKMGTALGLVAGLGFAILENAVYSASSMDINLLLLRAVTAAPIHAACGSRVGSAAIMLRTNPAQAIFRLLSATAIHGIYNLMVTMPGFPIILAILIAFSALITAILSIKGSWEGEGLDKTVKNK